jgi:hypothetical protein
MTDFLETCYRPAMVAVLFIVGMSLGASLGLAFFVLSSRDKSGDDE